MRAFSQTSAPPERLVRAAAIAIAAVLVVLVAAGSAVAAGPPGAIVATGLTEPGGVIVDPDGHAWVTDANGLCKVSDATAAGRGR